MRTRMPEAGRRYHESGTQAPHGDESDRPLRKVLRVGGRLAISFLLEGYCTRLRDVPIQKPKPWTEFGIVPLPIKSNLVSYPVFTLIAAATRTARTWPASHYPALR